jgi:hypothetical protein
VPNIAYFQDDDADAKRSLRAVLAAGARKLYVGHGGPLSAERVVTRFGMGRTGG